MKPYELNRGDKVYWTITPVADQGFLSGTVQNIVGRYANIQVPGRVMTIEIKLLRKTP